MLYTRCSIKIFLLVNRFYTLLTLPFNKLYYDLSIEIIINDVYFYNCSYMDIILYITRITYYNMMLLKDHRQIKKKIRPYSTLNNKCIIYTTQKKNQKYSSNNVYFDLLVY